MTHKDTFEGGETARTGQCPFRCVFVCGENFSGFRATQPKRVRGEALSPFPRGKSNLLICEPLFAYQQTVESLP